jgi:mono/diheme cytochrome c family protein
MKAGLIGIFAFFLAFSICLPDTPAQTGTPGFSEVQPIFRAHCTECHSGKRPPEALRLGSYREVMAGAKDGPVIVTGDPDKSELVKRVKGISKPRMPKDGPPWLSDKETAIIVKWIAAGANGTDAR